MTIVELLKSEGGRVDYGSRWLVWEESASEWLVMECRPHAKKTHILARTIYERVAVAALLAETGG